jgi:predicted enzyme related to lactoylglutathione lyase
MPEKTEYAPGTPSWVDLATPDVDRAGTFYATLFGWTAEPVPMPDAGGYVMFTLNGKYVAAMSPIEHGERPPAWTTYVSTDDADKTAELAQTAGGSVLMPPMDVFDSGRMAVLADPTGAAFAVWQPNQHPGAGLVDDPGTFTWTELSSRDTAAAARFYPEVFGWTAETSDGGGMQYTEFKLGDSSVAGMMEMNPMVPAEVPSYWMPYFAVVDVDKSAGEATALGAEALLPPSDFPGGRFAVIRDPQGATFGLLRLTPKA